MKYHFSVFLVNVTEMRETEYFTHFQSVDAEFLPMVLLCFSALMLNA